MLYLKASTDTFMAFSPEATTGAFPTSGSIPFKRYLRTVYAGPLPTPPTTLPVTDCLLAIADRWYHVMILASKQPNDLCTLDVFYLDKDE